MRLRKRRKMTRSNFRYVTSTAMHALKADIAHGTRSSITCVDGGCGARASGCKLPSALSAADSGRFLVCAPNGLSVEYDGPGREDKDAASSRTNVPIPSAGLALYYFEMTVVKEGALGRIAIGLSGKDVKLEKLPGLVLGSYGYHALDGYVYHNSAVNGEKYGAKYGQGDVVGCCWDMVDNVLFFTRNGVSLGTAFQNISPPLFPIIGLHSKGARVTLNFGSSPFMFNVDGYAREQREQVVSSILATPLLESRDFLAKTVLDYLIHAGYAESAIAFASSSGQMIDLDCKMSSDIPPDVDEPAVPASMVVVNDSSVANGKSDTPCGPSVVLPSENIMHLTLVHERQEIVSKVMKGQINEAIVHAQNQFPAFCITNIDTDFLVKSQQFIELLLSGEISLKEIVQFGRDELLHFHGSFPEQLEEIYSLLAYKDPATSPLSHLVGFDRRQIVADSLNASILVSLRRPAQSILERLFVQMQAVLEVHTEVANGPLAMLSGLEDIC